MTDPITIKEVKLKLGELCKKKRQDYSMSQSDLSEALGMSRYTIVKFENGKNATLDTALKIANHFDLLEAISDGINKTLADQNDITFY